MTEQKSLKKNFIMNILLTMSGFLFPLITFPYVSRVLGPGGNGKVSLAAAVISYFCMLAQLGIPTYGIRACAKVRDDRKELSRVVHELMLISLIMMLISYALLFLCIAAVPKFREEKILYLLVGSNILLTAMGMEWMYKGLEQYTYIAVRSVIFKAIALAAMFMLVRGKRDYVIYGGVTVIAGSASYICNFFHARRFVEFRPMGAYDLRRHWKPVLVFFAMACATTAYTNLDKVMLGFMATDSDVGLYHAAVRIKDILVAVITSLGAVLLPRAAYYVQKGRMDAFMAICRKALHFVILSAIPTGIFFLTFAREGIYLLSGIEYEGAVLPMQILMPTLLLIGITNLLGMEMLVPTGRERIVLISVTAGAIVDAVINAVLIPSMAASGAAVGTLAAEVIVLIVQLWYLRKEISEFYVRVPYWKILIGVAVAVTLSLPTRLLDLNAFLSLLLPAVLFFGGYAICMLLLKEEMMQEVLKTLTGKLGRNNNTD